MYNNAVKLTYLAGNKNMDSFVMLEVNPLVFERHGAVLALDVLSPVEPLHVVLVTVSWHLVTTLENITSNLQN